MDHLTSDLEPLKSLEMLDGSPFEEFNVHIERKYRQT